MNCPAFWTRLIPAFRVTCLTLCLHAALMLPHAALAVETDADAENLKAQSRYAESVDALGAPSDVWDRIRRGYAMPMLESPLVDKWVEYYSGKPAYLNRMFERSGQYLYHVLEEVESRGMPTELALLPFVESAFQPEALSHAKAAGLWQFMPSTGKQYDLTQNRWRDERNDVLESTRAALDYFQYLYGMFSDWQLSLAAYNWGEGSVSRAVKRQQAAGAPAGYLHLRMPSETANYVPKLEAIKRIVSEPAKYGVKLPDVGNEPYFVTVTKPRDIDLKTAAELAEMSQNEFKMLNPSYKLPVIVAAHDHVMLLPADRVDTFINNLASWMDSGQPLSHWVTYRLKEGETLAAVAERTGMTEDRIREVNRIPKGRRVLPNSTLLVRSTDDDTADITLAELDAQLRLSPETTWRRVVYRVRSGDTLPRVAARWRVTEASIIKANRLKNRRLRAGQRLILTVPNVERTTIAAAQQAQAAAPAPVPAVKHVIHTVRKGETLASVARTYGVSLADIKSTNRLSGSAIRVGQRLRVPAAGETAAASEARVHKVARGETLTKIADRYGVSVVRLKRENRLTGNSVKVGQRLRIPDAGQAERAAAPVKATAAKSSAPAARAGLYTVQRGETLFSVARRFGVDVSALRSANGISGNAVRVGQKLVIPATAKSQPKASESKDAVYRVRKGDTLASVARSHGTSISALRRVNNLKTNALTVGQTLKLP